MADTKIDHQRIQDVIGLARVGEAAMSGGSISTSQYLELADHYQDLHKKVMAAEGQPGDREIITMYSGSCRRVPTSYDGDPRNGRIVVIDQQGEPREIYRGANFDEAEYKARTKDDH